MDIKLIKARALPFLQNWHKISVQYKLTEDFIREFQDKLDWESISEKQILSEDFIREFQDKVDWCYISQYQVLSEDFIREFKDEVNWLYISKCQLLSEDFIREFEDKVAWYRISESQVLSEDFIIEFKDKINFCGISQYQILSDKFIRKFQNRVQWDAICEHQILSEDFIREFKDKVDWGRIYRYQKLSKDFIREFASDISIRTWDCEKAIKSSPHNSEYNWLYASDETKRKAIEECGLYTMNGDYVIAYKGILRNGSSAYNNQYRYKVGGVYESQCNCSQSAENSFGLSAWTLDRAKKYCDEKIIKVRIHISDIGALVYNSNKIRCFKFEVIGEVK